LTSWEIAERRPDEKFHMAKAASTASLFFREKESYRNKDRTSIYAAVELMIVPTLRHHQRVRLTTAVSKARRDAKAAEWPRTDERTQQKLSSRQ